jgi:NADPH:quinone reductase-like Zn-dependent oxidoreductase
MKAFVSEKYGIDKLELREIEQSKPEDDEVLVRVRAASVNPADYYSVTGMIAARAMGGGLRKPKQNRVGTDFAGTVEAVGAKVTKFKPGDPVFGARTGAIAEYVAVPEDRAIAPKPENVTFEEAGGVAIAGITALQGLRDHAQLRPGHKVLIECGSGGVGTFAVQLAKAFGADVTAVCSTPNVEIARSLGADRVIDRTREDFTRNGERYDTVLGVQSTHSWSAYRRALKPEGTFVLVGAPRRNSAFGPLGHVARMFVATRLRRRPRFKFFVAKLTGADMNVMRELLESGKVKTVVDRTFPLSDAADAFRYLGEGHARGKIVVTVGA